VAYLPFAPTGLSSLRDGVLVAVSRLGANRVLVHVHGEGMATITHGYSFRAWILRAMLRNCEIIAITRETAEAAVQSGLFRHVWSVPNGIPDPGWIGNLQMDGSIRIAYVANMHPAKGVDLLLRSLQQIARHGLNFYADIIGDTSALLSLTEVQRMISDLGLDKNVVVHGPLFGDEKFRVLASANLYVYPSRHDHAPLVLLEAMALGLVPIVLNTGAMAEMVGPDFAPNVIGSNAADSTIELHLAERIEYYDKNRDRLAADAHLSRARYLTAYTEQHFYRQLIGAFLGREPARSAADVIL
jgi:glycosyltransferase involved in cell wall biosynthesis